MWGGHVIGPASERLMLGQNPGDNLSNKVQNLYADSCVNEKWV